MHVFGLEGRSQGCHFVDHAAKGPDVTLKVVRLISPHLRTCVVGGTRLCVIESVLICQLGHIHVTQLAAEVVIHEDVCRLDVAVHDVVIVESPEAAQDLDQQAPDFALLEPSTRTLVIGNLLVEVSIVCVLHDNAARASGYWPKVV